MISGEVFLDELEVMVKEIRILLEKVRNCKFIMQKCSEVINIVSDKNNVSRVEGLALVVESVYDDVNAISVVGSAGLGEIFIIENFIIFVGDYNYYI